MTLLPIPNTALLSDMPWTLVANGTFCAEVILFVAAPVFDDGDAVAEIGEGSDGGVDQGPQ